MKGRIRAPRPLRAHGNGRHKLGERLGNASGPLSVATHAFRLSQKGLFLSWALPVSRIRDLSVRFAGDLVEGCKMS